MEEMVEKKRLACMLMKLVYYKLGKKKNNPITDYPIGGNAFPSSTWYLGSFAICANPY